MGTDLGTEEEKILGDIMKKDGNEFYYIIKYPLIAKPFILCLMEISLVGVLTLNARVLNLQVVVNVFIMLSLKKRMEDVV